MFKMFCRDIKALKNINKLPQTKTTMSEMKDILDGINSWLDFEEEKIKKILNLNTQQYELSGDKKQKNVQNISHLWNSFKRMTVCVIGLPKGEERESRRQEEKIEEIMAEKFPNFKKNCKPTDTRSSTNLKHRTMKRIYNKAYNN